MHSSDVLRNFSTGNEVHKTDQALVDADQIEKSASFDAATVETTNAVSEFGNIR